MKARGLHAGRAPALVALAALLLAGCQLVSGLAGIEVASTTGTGGNGGETATFPCSPDPATCPEAASPCLALTAPSASGPTTLRISQLDLVRPAGLYGTGVKSFLSAGITLNLPAASSPASAPSRGCSASTPRPSSSAPARANLPTIPSSATPSSTR